MSEKLMPSVDVLYDRLSTMEPRRALLKMYDHARQLERELAEARSAITRIKIPTDTMEQEFQSHYRRGYEAGKAAAISSTADTKGSA